MIETIPLIITNYNQLTYTRNLVNWFKWYYPNNPVVILDNASNYQPLLDWYDNTGSYGRLDIVRYQQNDAKENLKAYLAANQPEWYIVSDPDIMPHPNTPFNFLEIFVREIERGTHHIGFQLIIDDLPDWLHKKGWIIGDENLLRNNKVNVEGYEGYKAPIDTTFALYRSSNGGWQSPMSSRDWDNSIRLFNAYHLAWYLDGEILPEEMKAYYNNALYREIGKPSAGRNNYRPKEYEPKE